MRDYEMVVVLDAQLTTAKQKTFLDNIGKIVELAGGKVDETSDWGKRELAYPIKKQTDGIYFLLNFKLPPDQVFALDQKIKLMDNVLRQLIIARSLPTPRLRQASKGRPSFAKATEGKAKGKKQKETRTK